MCPFHPIAWSVMPPKDSNAVFRTRIPEMENNGQLVMNSAMKLS